MINASIYFIFLYNSGGVFEYIFDKVVHEQKSSSLRPGNDLSFVKKASPWNLIASVSCYCHCEKPLHNLMEKLLIKKNLFLHLQSFKWNQLHLISINQNSSSSSLSLDFIINQFPVLEIIGKDFIKQFRVFITYLLHSD